MTTFTEDEFRSLIHSSVGIDSEIDLDGDILDTLFSDLGYDSLAVLEIANVAEKKFGVVIPEESIADLETPRQFIVYVNENLPARA